MGFSDRTEEGGELGSDDGESVKVKDGNGLGSSIGLEENPVDG